MYSPPSLSARKVCVTSRDVLKTVGNVIISPLTLRRKTGSNGGMVSGRKRTAIIMAEKLAVLAIIHRMPFNAGDSLMKRFVIETGMLC